MWYYSMKNGALRKNAGERRTFHPKYPSDSVDSLVWRRALFHLRCHADSTAKSTTAKPVSDSQSFSDVDTVDDSCFADDRHDGVFYRRME